MIDVENRPDLGVDDFQFLLAFYRRNLQLQWAVIWIT